MRQTIHIAIFTLALVGVLAFIFFHTQNDNVQRNNNIVKELYDVSYYDSLVLREIVDLRANQAASYDRLVSNVTMLQQSVDELEGLLEASDQGKSKNLAMTELKELLSARNDDIEHFKSTSAIVKNSLARVPDMHLLIVNQVKKPSLASEEREVYDHLHNFISQYLSGTPSELVDESILDALKKIESYQAKFGKADLSLLYTHLPVFLRQRQKQIALVQKILAYDTTTAIRKVHAAYDAVYIQNVIVANRVRWLLFVMCLALLPYTVYTSIKQRYLNQHLDQKVIERTDALSTLNATLQDEIMEKVLAQKAMEETQQQLIQSSKLAALGEMAGGIAHEINNPIAIIDMRIQQLIRLLDKDPFPKDMAMQFCQAIRTTSQQVAKIISGLRTFSRSGDQDPFSEANIFDIVADSLSFCRERFAHHNIELHAETQGHTLINCRPVQISQVMVNLLNNAHDAIRHSPEPRWVKVTLQTQEDTVQVMVTDSGQGIPDDIQRKIFQPFFTTKDVGSGTGLGLSVSASIIKMHGGELYVDHHCPNTCFVMSLPRKDGSQVPTSTAA